MVYTYDPFDLYVIQTALYQQFNADMSKKVFNSPFLILFQTLKGISTFSMLEALLKYFPKKKKSLNSKSTNNSARKYVIFL